MNLNSKKTPVRQRRNQQIDSQKSPIVMNSEIVIKSKFNLESTPSVDQKTVDEEYDVGD